MSSSLSELPILFQDEHFIVINKFSGLLVHASKIDPNETKFALQMLRDQIGAKVFTVHRLDKATSGALLFATSSEAAKLIGEEFAGGRVFKKYLAIVRGIMPDEINVDHALKEIHDRKTDAFAQKDKPAQAARTFFRSRSSCEILEPVDRYPTARYSLVEAIPETGRKHQIRRHLKHLSHPIIGDVNYGSGIHNQFFRDKFGCRRMLLACTHLSFTHPFTKVAFSIEAPLEENFKNVVEQLGFTK